MSKTITLEIPDEVFSSFQKQAESKGVTMEKFVLDIILKYVSQNINSDTKNSEKHFAHHFGSINSGNSRSADNEQIDIDLAAEYGRGL